MYSLGLTSHSKAQPAGESGHKEGTYVTNGGLAYFHGHGLKFWVCCQI